MHVYELAVDSAYRSLDFATDGEPLRIDHNLFAEPGPIGDRWVIREVTDYDDSDELEDDCCEADLAPYEREQPDLERKMGDFPHFWGGGMGLLSQRAYAALHDLLQNSVEFLPLTSKWGNFYALKVHRIVDALNVSESKIEWDAQLKRDAGKPRIAHRILKHAFHEDRLAEETIFQIPQKPFHLYFYVTDRFVRVVEEQKLEGFKFTQVWPPIDERAHFLERRRKKTGH